MTQTAKRRLGLVGAVLCALVVSLVLAGCTGATSGEKRTTTQQAEDAATESQGGDAAVSEPAELTDEVPAGREIAEGGGGPKAYTFREEWRRALAQARKWRSGAYLITASGDMVNDDGVPSNWNMLFIDREDPDTVLMLDVDPWGKVTSERKVTGDDVRSFVGEYTKPIPYDIIDSDQAVAAGKELLASKYAPDKTRDPRMGLNFSVIDGSGPWWTYTLFHTSSAEYVTARIDALTGEASWQE